MIWPIVKRIAAVFTGFVLAILTAVFSLLIIGGRWAASEVASHTETGAAPDVVSDVFGLFAFIFVAAPTLTLLPALAVVIVGEVAKIRSVLYYVVMGGLATAVMPLVVTPPESVAGSAPSVQYLTIYATAGFAAGLVYWLIAGRNA